MKDIKQFVNERLKQIERISKHLMTQQYIFNNMTVKTQRNS